MKAKLNNAYENSEQTVKYICIYIYMLLSLTNLIYFMFKADLT